METRNQKHDLIIVGAGPAGLGASIYASRYKLDHLIIGNEIGGQVVEASEIENWAGEISITGQTLMEKFEHHAKHLGGKIVKADVSKIEKIEDGFEVSTEEEKYQTRSIILALGMRPRKANIPGEDKFIGKGISYCATCDAMFFRGKDVVVIGGGDAAATAALHLTEFANKVTLLYLEGGKIFEPSWDEQIQKSGKIELLECSKITGVIGDQKVSGLTYEIKEEKKELAAQGVFIEVGTTPGVTLAQGLGVALDEQSYIVVDQAQATNVENICAAGDVTTGSNKFRQIITAVAEGAVAAGTLYRKLKLNKK
jgi:thioredoxin reductase (NADPH)